MAMLMPIAVLLGAAVAGPGPGHGPVPERHAASPLAPASTAGPAAAPARLVRDPAVARRDAAAWRGTDWDDYLTRLRRLAGAPVQVALADERTRQR